MNSRLPLVISRISCIHWNDGEKIDITVDGCLHKYVTKDESTSNQGCFIFILFLSLQFLMLFIV